MKLPRLFPRFTRQSTPKPKAANFSGSFGGYPYTYLAAQVTRDRSWQPVVTVDTKHTLTPYARRVLMSHARFLVANFGLAKAAANDLARYTVGTGLVPQSQAADPVWRDEAEAMWREAVKIIDVTRRHDFNALCRLAVAALAVDGDCGFILTETTNGFPQLQMVEAHRMGDCADVDPPTTDGVILDSYGRPQAYRVSDDNFGNTAEPVYQDIPADDFIHFYNPHRSDAVRGLTYYAHAINNLRDMLDIIAFEKLGVKESAAIGLVIKNQDGAVGAGFFGDAKPPEAGTQITYEQMRGGAIPRLSPGEEIQSFSSNRPNTTFNGFLEYLARDVSVGFGFPLEFLWNPQALGGASQRFVIAKAMRVIDEHQKLVTRLIADRLWYYAISKQMKRGELRSSKGMKDWWKVTWQTPARLTVDVGRESKANLDEIRQGTRTLAEDTAERGVDWQELRDQIETETADLLTRADRLTTMFPGLTRDAAVALLRQTSANAPALTAPQPDASNPEDLNPE